MWTCMYQTCKYTNCVVAYVDPFSLSLSLAFSLVIFVTSTNLQQSIEQMLEQSNNLISCTECNPNCTCQINPSKCFNRVVQLTPVNPELQLQIFKTEKCGFGVRTLKNISANTYVCEYIGK